MLKLSWPMWVCVCALGGADSHSAMTILLLVRLRRFQSEKIGDVAFNPGVSSEIYHDQASH